MRVTGSLTVLFLMAGACSTQPAGSDVGAGSDIWFKPGDDVQVAEISAPEEEVVAADLQVDELFEDGRESHDLTEPGCEPGTGCFLEPCAENADCLSGWCVDHMGDRVCTQTCLEECPAGWTCSKVMNTEPDVIFICVSDFPVLCRPCAATGNCDGSTGSEDVCVDYGDKGSFCGGHCDPGAAGGGDCPAGFVCEEVATVDGVLLNQCLPEDGVCPCTELSVKLGLWTPCHHENSFGLCSGKRVCTGDGLTECDAGVPAYDLCNGKDDDCDEVVDEEPCEDNNPCTADSCGGEAGCSNQPLTGAPCDDGSVCTAPDQCLSGICQGTPLDCNDNNPCSNDGCMAPGGCTHTPNSAPCDDANLCTFNDLCSGGLCTSGGQLDCDDGNACTTDGCLADSGCTHGNVDGSCPGGTCVDGECTCQIQCAGKKCGDDGCGGNCGVCSEGFNCISGVCQEAVGGVHLLLTDHSENRIYKLSLDGVVIATFQAPVAGVMGVAHDLRNPGSFWVCNNSQPALFHRLDLTTGAVVQTLNSTGWGFKQNDIRGLSFFRAEDSVDDMLVVNGINTNSIDVTNGVKTADGGGGFQSSFHKGAFLAGFWGVAQQGEGNSDRWVTNYDFDTVENWSSATYISGFSISLTEPRGIAIDDQGYFWVVDAGTKKVNRFSPAGEADTSWSTPGSDPRGISFGSD
jgi:hypothetical protein